MEYAVYLGRGQVGTVVVQRQGLYYRFLCRCDIVGGQVCRLYVTSSAGRENLGVLVPTAGGFGLDTKVAAKRIGEGELRFDLRMGREPACGRFVPITPEEPFSYIAKLKDAYLEQVDGRIGVVIPDSEG